MDQHDAPNNVYALFPGIDTRPFGKRTQLRTPRADLADAAWSAEVPERTLADADDAPLDDKQLADPGRRRSRTARRLWLRVDVPVAVWIAVAVLAGGALAGGRALLAAPGGHRSHVALTASGHAPPAHVGQRVLRSAVRPHDIKRARGKPQQQARAPKHRTRPARSRQSTARAGSAASATYTSTAGQAATTLAGSTPAVSQPVQPIAPANTTSGEPVAGVQSASQPAGPTGLGQQVGGSCDPQCK